MTKNSQLQNHFQYDPLPTHFNHAVGVLQLVQLVATDMRFLVPINGLGPYT